MEFRGDAFTMASGSVSEASLQLRGLRELRVTCEAHRLRPLEPSPLAPLAECGDPRCGAHRLRQPTVRRRFRSYVTRSVRRSGKDGRGRPWWE